MLSYDQLRLLQLHIHTYIKREKIINSIKCCVLIVSQRALVEKMY